jgi:hypothetical protein
MSVYDIATGKRTIWKLDVHHGLFKIELPEYHDVLTVQKQYGSIKMWVLVDPDAPKVTREFLLVPTGVEMVFGDVEDPPGATLEHTFRLSCHRRLRYINTVQIAPFEVYHLFQTWLPPRSAYWGVMPLPTAVGEDT